MFPYDTDDEEEIELEEDEEIEEEAQEPPSEFDIDFKTGRMTGGKVSGSRAVAVWAWNALMYPRYRYEIEDFQYGSELSDLIGQVMTEDEAALMAETIIRDAFTPNEYIEDIEDMDCEIEDDHLNITFTLVTSFGEEDMDVTIRG